MLIYLHSMPNIANDLTRPYQCLVASYQATCVSARFLIVLFLHTLTTNSYSGEWQSDFVTCEMSNRQSVETHITTS